MLRGTRENISLLASISNCAGVMALCFLLLATTVVVLPQNLHSSLLQPAYAQQVEEEGEEGTTDTGTEEEGEEGTTTTTTEPLTAEIISNYTAEDDHGAPATFSFDADASGGTGPYTVNWNFGDDSEESDEQSVVHTFTEAGNYTVTLTVTDSEDQTATDTLEITVEESSEEPATDEEPPATESLAAEITSNATSGNAPATFSFDANASGGTGPYTVNWNFGDDSEESDEQSVVHTFTEAGNYTVTLTATDSTGETATDTLEITVEESSEEPATDEEPPATESLAAEITSNATSGNAPATFSFDANASGGTGPYTVNWNFGDDSEESDEQSVVHTFTEAGNYTVTLTATDSTGESTTIKSIGTGVWQVDARSGTQEHGIRMHVDSPTGKWKNTEMTGYFNIHSGDDQFTMIARHGPSYHDNGGCEAYGYYALTAVDGQVFFKKKLYHFNDGYTKRLASVNALGDIHDDWVGMKFVVYDLPNGDVKLELWIDKGDMTNKWQKETELIDKGNLAVTGGDDCGRDATDKIDSGTRVSFRADNSLFDFKKLSVREIQEGSTPASTTEDTTTEDTTPASTTEDTTTEDTTPASTTEDTTTEDTTTEDTTPEEDLSTEDLIPSGLRSWLSY